MNRSHQTTGYFRHGALAMAISLFAMSNSNAQTIIPIETAHNALVLQTDSKKM
ncbi:hypothetical protein [Pedobacter sp. P26]|uniref:hypothetical protein n=1 Tax=Pedobacter sp. P26 TaxID=3423956 RepID=UPI003D671B3B